MVDPLSLVISAFALAVSAVTAWLAEYEASFVLTRMRQAMGEKSLEAILRERLTPRPSMTQTQELQGQDFRAREEAFNRALAETQRDDEQDLTQKR